MSIVHAQPYTRQFSVGGFVIFGQGASATLGTCLDNLARVCEEVVAVDTGADEASTAVARASGARIVRTGWEGYGAARAVAVANLRSDYVFYLDADESLSPESITNMLFDRRLIGAPSYALTRYDWVVRDGSDRFLFRRERQVRLIRRNLANWRRSMVVHESLGLRSAVLLKARIDHRFHVGGVDLLRLKLRRYALLWAVQTFSGGRSRAKPESLVWLAHLVRNAAVKGAAFRGGAFGLRIATVVAGYHGAKQRYLGELASGAHTNLVTCYLEGRYRDLFALVNAET